jgi:hypothetical protein
MTVGKVPGRHKSNVLEKKLENSGTVHQLFIDSEKAYDSEEK